MKLLNARLIDGTGKVREHVDIELEGTKFGAITQASAVAENTSTNPQMADILDLNGQTVIPGLFNCHVHVMLNALGNPDAALQTESLPYLALEGAKRVRGMLEAGITTARDLGGFQYAEMAIKKALLNGLISGPRLLVSGKVLTMTGGHGNFFGAEVDGTDEVRKAARHNIKMGADCIKMMATGGVMTPGVDPNNSSLSEEELRAGFEEAHKAQKLSASHAQGTSGIKNAVRAGVRTIEHGVYLDDEAIAMMLERGTYLVPTLAAPRMIYEFGEAAGVPKFMVDKSAMIMEFHHRSAAMAYKAGVKIACGSDAGTPFNKHEDIVTEITMLHEVAGMTTMEALCSATRVAAEAMKMDDKLGTVETGKLADFVVLAADPLADLTALAAPIMVWKEGAKVFQSSAPVAG